jgi:predicted Rossmann fold nucleotide-binding protein DprA/Smf involved in DNA uptake
MGQAMPRGVTITGTRSTGHRPPSDYPALFEEFIRPFATPSTRFYLGGATGIDSLGLLWLADETKANLTVAVPAKLVDQPADARHAIATAQAANRLDELVELCGEARTPGYHARNRWMVDRSDFVIGFPHGEGGGTVYTLNYAAEQGKPHLVVPV